MVLGLFEMMTGCNQRSLEAWAEHIHGAAALLQLRGDDQFETDAGVNIYFQTVIGLMTSCLQRSIAIPEPIVHMTYKLANSAHGQHPSFKFHLTIVALTWPTVYTKRC